MCSLMFSAPLKEDETMFDVFLEKERKAQYAASRAEKQTEVVDNKKPATIKKKKPEQPQERKPKLNDLEPTIKLVCGNINMTWSHC